MTNLLTKAEYAAIAAKLDYPHNAFINGAFRPAQAGATFTTVNPANGAVLSDVAACEAVDVDFAVAKAKEVFERGDWAKLHPSERKAALIKLSKLLKRHHQELAVLESVDSGKTIYDCVTVDVPETIHCLQWHAESIDKIYDQVAPAAEDHMALIVREPIGVVGLVLPWNFPLLMLAWKIAPALAAGCSVVVKPAEETPLSALRVAELAMEAGIPAGVFNVLPGSGSAAGEPLGRHPDVDLISFTGSTATGRRFLHYAAESNLKEVVLEMGGKNPCIVLDDAEDLDQVAAHVVNGAFWNMGENCSAASRLIVHEDIKEALLQRVLAHAREWPVGDPLDPTNRIGALVSDAHCSKVAGYIEQCHGDGCDVLLGGGAANDNRIEPTIVSLDDANHALAQEEIFGPVLSVLTVKTFDQAIQAANNTCYGLAASVFTANGKRGLRAARMIKAGTVTINSFGEGDISTPFGGYKQSGFGGRDNSLLAHDQYTQVKTIWVDLTDNSDACVD